MYSVGQHQGLCAAPYIVLRNNGPQINMSLYTHEYELLLYYPTGKYSQLEDAIEALKQYMNKLYPALRLVGQDPDYLDEDVQAYMVALRYQMYRPHQINTVNRKD